MYRMLAIVCQMDLFVRLGSICLQTFSHRFLRLCCCAPFKKLWSLLGYLDGVRGGGDGCGLRDLLQQYVM